MVSKEELRKLDKEELVDLVYDLSIKVDALTRLVEDLQQEIKRLKTPKNSGNSSLPRPRTCSDIRTKAFGKKVIRNPVVKRVTKEKHFGCRLLRIK